MWITLTGGIEDARFGAAFRTSPSRGILVEHQQPAEVLPLSHATIVQPDALRPCNRRTMMTYIDAFAVSVPKDKVETYRSMLA